MLKEIICFLSMVGMFSSVTLPAFAATVEASKVQQAFLARAVKGDFSKIEKLKLEASIDTVNKAGDTALCSAIKLKNVEAYNVLVKAGANLEHDCVQKINPNQKKAFCALPDLASDAICKKALMGTNYAFSNVALNTAGVALVAGGVAVAVSGGGGGGSGSEPAICADYPLTVCPEHATCSSCADDETKLKVDSCVDGWEGANCENPIVPEPAICADYPLTVCPEHATCSSCADDETKLKVDSCAEGWEGENCETKIPTIEDCLAGTYWNGTSCQSCAANQYSLPQSDACLNCPFGSYSNAGDATCTQCLTGDVCGCPTGFIWNNAFGECIENMPKNDCLGGRKVNTDNGVVCVCPDGYLLQEGTCVKRATTDGNVSVCPDGYLKKDGACLKIAAGDSLQCQEGYQFMDGFCFNVLPAEESGTDETPSVDNYSLNAENNDLQCPDGYSLENELCVNRDDFTCPTDYQLIDGVCLKATDFLTGDTVITEETGAVSMTNTNTLQYGVVAELSATAENKYEISGLSDGGLVGMFANGTGVREDSGVYTPATADNKGTISLAHVSDTGASLIGMKVAAGATIRNTGDIEITSLSSAYSYGMYAEAYYEDSISPVDNGYDVINDGNIILKAQGRTKNLYGLYALKRTVENNGSISVLYSNLNTTDTTIGTVSALYSRKVSEGDEVVAVNNGVISLMREDTGSSNGANLNFNAIHLGSSNGKAVNGSYFKDETTGFETGLISLQLDDMPYFVRAMYGQDANNQLLNDGKIQITGQVSHKDLTGDFGGVYAMYAGQGGNLLNKGIITLGTTQFNDATRTWATERNSLKLSGSNAFISLMDGMTNMEIANNGRILVDLEPTANDASLAMSILNMNSGSITNSGLIAVNVDSDTVSGFTGSSVLSVIRTNQTSSLRNTGTVHITSGMDNFKINVFSSVRSADAINNTNGVVEIFANGDNVDVEIFDFSDGTARNDGIISVIQDGKYGSVVGIAGGQGSTGSTEITLKNGQDNIITAFTSGSGINEGNITVNLDGDSYATTLGMDGVDIDNSGHLLIRSVNKSSKSNFGSVTGINTYEAASSSDTSIGTSNGTTAINDSKIEIDMKGAGSVIGVNVGGLLSYNLPRTASYAHVNNFTNYGLIDLSINGDETNTDTTVIGINNIMSLISLGLDPLNPEAFVLERDHQFNQTINKGTITINAQNIQKTDDGILVSTGNGGASRYLPFDIAGILTNGHAVNDGDIIINTNDTNGDATGSARAVGILVYDGGSAINNGTITFTGKSGTFVGLYGTGYRDITFVDRLVNNKRDIHHAASRVRQYSTVYNNGEIIINGNTYDGKVLGNNDPAAVLGDNNALLSKPEYDAERDYTEVYHIDNNGLENKNPTISGGSLGVNGELTDTNPRGAYAQTEFSSLGSVGAATISLVSSPDNKVIDGVVWTKKAVPVDSWIINGSKTWSVNATRGSDLELTNLNGSTTTVPFDAIGLATNGYALNLGTLTIEASGDGRIAGMLAYDGGVVENKGTIAIKGSNRDNVTALYAVGSRDVVLYETVKTLDTNGNEVDTDIVRSEMTHYSTMYNSGTIKIIDDENKEKVLTADKDIYGGDGKKVATNGAYNMDALGYTYDEDQNGYIDVDKPHLVDILSSTETISSVATSFSAPVTILNQGVNYVTEDGGVFSAEGTQVVGDVLAGTTLVQKGNENVYLASGKGEGVVIGNGDTSRLGLGSMSAMFDASWEQNAQNANGFDIVLTRRNFAELTDNSSLASFLEANYANGNNEAFFNDLKSAETAVSFNASLDSLTGRDTIAKFTHEDLTAMREVNFAMNELMFANNDKPMFETNGSLNTFNFKNDNNSSAQYALANKRISPRMKIGYAMSTTNLNTDNDDDTTRRNSVFQVFAPISYDRSGWQMIATPQIGFARGHYTRKGYNGTSYEGVIEKRIFALMNEARYPMTVGKFEIAPTVEF
ncbi:MAG: hypothetical protein E7013_02335, partial [Alphaproteobacteria bacterium]|nr:hypothetical protein [Alphaproteobacteria bacterium]